MSAAVSDYTINQTAPNKIKKGEPDPKVHLVPTEDILKAISSNKGSRIIVGFALETENVLENALKKLREKHLDIVVANNPLAEGSGFQVETNQVFIIHRNGAVLDLPLQSKREVAREILNAVMELYRNPLPEPDVEPDISVDIEPEPDDHGLVRLAGLDVDDVPVSKRANGTPPPQRAIPQTGEQQLGKKGKSRRGGRRVRERRERLAARAAGEQVPPPAQTPAPTPPPTPRVTVTPPPAPAPVAEKKSDKKKHHRSKKSKPAAPVEAPAPKAEEKPAPKPAVKKAPKKAAARKSAKKPEKTEA
jgi:hypothetical protein